jgi:hypothetical protein
MDINSLTIGEAKEIANIVGGTKALCGRVSHGLQIVVLDKGFVYVGDTETDKDYCYIKNSKNVRRWGTSNGLGELAAKGPQSESKLDPSGNVKAPISALIHMIECRAEAWKK